MKKTQYDKKILSRHVDSTIIPWSMGKEARQQKTMMVVLHPHPNNKTAHYP